MKLASDNSMRRRIDEIKKRLAMQRRSKGKQNQAAEWIMQTETMERRVIKAWSPKAFFGPTLA